MEKTIPLVILGLDAGTPEFIEKWVQEGYLPNIAAIMKRGCWGRTTGIDLLNEDGVWTRMFSGIPQSQHEFYYFRQLKLGTYDLYPVSEIEKSDYVFWSLLQKQHKKVALIDVPEMSILPNLNGIQLANWAVHNSHYIPSASQPSNLLPEIRQVFGQAMNITENFISSFAKDRQIYHRLLERVEKKGRLCRYLLAKDKFDLAIIVFGECHTGGHQLWKYRPEAQGDEKVTDQSELTHSIRDIYQAIDRQIGLLLQQLPDHINLVVVSSVGIKDQYPTGGLIEDFCRKLGYQVSREPNSKPASLLSLVRQLTPEAWRVALSRYFPRETRERLLAEQFLSSTNWSKTRAFAIPSAYMSFLRVNLQGREPQGIVKVGTEYETVLQQLEEDLRQLIDPRSGQAAVKEIYRADHLFGPERHQGLPDLFVSWQPFPYFMDCVLHPKIELTQKKPDFFRGSDHSQQGFFAAAGPSIQQQGTIGEISLLDLAPTFLELLQQPIPEWMSGQPIIKSSGRV
ncbi:hypothetical protein C7H19_00010 [Aphanothece hegewaldii CCALA 016]|uniref:Phosphodiesterase n=1 Tax=Aphanothece hegewaldii CCALA 016 TaxID=2107694 RepID=A0A2T1M308_9CHRO|nr:alkaline phosphatase family protein [Aphanothece hegewaldii]PSF39212.1 hypothetical protein C7H19_00010 [Aphanothece hegewaldii CCALA 016]